MAYLPSGFKAKISVNDGASQAYVELDGVTTCSFPDYEAEMEDMTPLNQTGVQRINRPKGLVKVGPLKFVAMFSKANVDRLNALLKKEYQAVSTLTTWKLETPDPDGSVSADNGKIITYPGVLAKISYGDFSDAGKPLITCEVVNTDQVTFTDGTNGATLP